MTANLPRKGTLWVERGSYHIEHIDGVRHEVGCTWRVTSVKRFSDTESFVYAKPMWVGINKARQFNFEEVRHWVNDSLKHQSWHDRMAPYDEVTEPLWPVRSENWKVK